MRLNGMMILSEDPPRLRDYYVKLFGEPAMDGGGFSAWEMGPGVLIVVGPHDEVTGKNVQPSRLMWGIESADVKGDYERLKAAGATVVRELYQDEGSGMWVATFSDPDDNYFQISTPPP